MTTEEKAKAYDIVLDKIKRLLGTGSNCSREELEYVFPELAESGDERTKKEILDYIIKGSESCYDVQQYGREKFEKWIAWLEKRGDKVSAIEGFETEFERQVSHLIASAINREHEYNEEYVKWTANALLNFAKHELEKQGEQKPAEWRQDNVEELTEFENVMMHIGSSFFGENAGLNPNDTTCIKEQANLLLELVEQKPADKAEQKFEIGDKIIDKSFPKNVFTVTEIINEGIAYVDKTGERFTKYYDEDDWDEYELVEQKPAWSEENDEKYLDAIEKLIIGSRHTGYNGVSRNDAVDWLKSLKERVQPQPRREWSEEDEREWNNIWDVLDGRFELSKEGYKSDANWFKSIKDRYTWKPSDEQISVLSRSLKYINTISQNYCHVLGELLAQLKKLREE